MKKRYLRDGAEKNGKYRQKDCRNVISQIKRRGQTIHCLPLFTVSSSRFQSGSLRSDTIFFPINHLPHAAAAEFVRNFFEAEAFIKGFLALLGYERNAGTPAGRRVLLHIGKQLPHDCGADFPFLESRMNHNIHDHKIQAVSDQSAHCDRFRLIYSREIIERMP